MKARSNPLSQIAYLDPKAKTWFEVSAATHWEKLADDMKKIKVSHSLPPLAKLFEDKTHEFFGISAWSEGEVRNSTFACFKKKNMPTTS